MICRYKEGAIWLEAGSDPQAEQLQVAALAVGTFSGVAQQSFQAEQYVEPAFWRDESSDPNLDRSRRASNHDLEQLLDSYNEDLVARAAFTFRGLPHREMVGTWCRQRPSRYYCDVRCTYFTAIMLR
jgi:hypothetical protein